MALIGVSTASFVLAEEERSRVCYISAMRRCLLRIEDMIRYEEPPLFELLMRLDLRTTPQERQLTSMLHACAHELEQNPGAKIAHSFRKKTKRIAGYGILTEEDKNAFESVLEELGCVGKMEQLKLLLSAEERLKRREEAETDVCRRRAKLISSLGVTAGAALFLLLI